MKFTINNRELIGSAEDFFAFKFIKSLYIGEREIKAFTALMLEMWIEKPLEEHNRPDPYKSNWRTIFVPFAER